MKTICVDIDDTLNNFTEVLKETEVIYDDYRRLDRETFDKYLNCIKNNKPPEDNDKFSDFDWMYHKVHEHCYKLANARPDAIKFMQWLKTNDWQIFILTYRDLRSSLNDTKEWLRDNRIPYDYIFSAMEKPVFCRLWKIDYLIDDSLASMVTSTGLGVKLYYPITDTNRKFMEKANAFGFTSFDELYNEFEVAY